MKLIKLNTDHYIIVDDSEIKEGDWVYQPMTNAVYKTSRTDNSDIGYKITNSTQPLEYILVDNKYDSRTFAKIQYLPIQEVKELIGEVDVEKKAINSWEGCDGCDTNDELFFTNGYQRGYNQALEDNKGKKYTDDDVIRIVEKSRETGLTAEYLMMTFQPKTEWDVEFVDGKIKLKQ